MPRPPHESAVDSTAALLADPYDFIRKRCQRHGSDAFGARLLGRDMLCLQGAAMAEHFYDPALFERAGAAPEPLRATLFGKGGVQALDGEPHRVRKAMFLRLMSPASIARLVSHTRNEWEGALRRWPGDGAGGRAFPLYDALHPMLMRAVCAWAGVALPSAEVASRTEDVVLLFDAAGRIGTDHLRARLARGRCEEWLAGMIEQVRAEAAPDADDAAGAADPLPLHAVAFHRDADGARLPARVAAVELLNLIRPTVAVSVYIVFAAHALHVHPHCRTRIADDADGSDGEIGRFVQEVRRWYPFFPATVARARQDAQIDGVTVRAGQRVLLDLYGAGHDERQWPAPEVFDPERFRHREPTAYDLMPQGGGDHAHGHRCPGEWSTIALMELAVDYLVHRVRYTVPAQDLWIDKTRLPALPRSRFVIGDLQPVRSTASA
jgi:fatty-acid peroxygenase